MPINVTPGWSTTPVEQGDTLHRIAYRVLQDATRWPEIAWLNDLLPPYLSGNPALPGVITGRVLLYGSQIRVPSASPVQQGVTPAQAYGVDVSLSGGKLTADTLGGLAIVSGGPNLRQALEMRLSNELGCLGFHPKYGNGAHRLKGRKADHNASLLAVRYCMESVLSDPRVSSVRDGSYTQTGDAIFVTITAVVKDGTPLSLQVEI